MSIAPAFDSLLTFTPIYQPRVWGSRRLQSLFGRALPGDGPIGEAWELVDRADHQSVVASGPHTGTTLHALWAEHRREVFGAAAEANPSPRFPLLIKILDCADDLSIQVHPPAAIAPSLGGEPKTEMWFVASAEPGARIYAGLRSGVTRDGFERALADGTVADAVHEIDTRTGDSLFVPSGRLHALGAGLVIFEIQQNSDTTYRVFDWNRLGLDGRPRDLHIEQSLASIDFSDVEPISRRGDGELAVSPYFRVSRVRTGHQVPADRGRLIMAVAETTWAGESLAPGQLALGPAAFKTDGPRGEWLEIEIPD